MLDPLRTQIQKRDGTWAEISTQSPIPVWMNLEVLVPYLERISELLPVSIKSLVDLAAEINEILAESREGTAGRLDKMSERLDEATTFIMWFMIAQGVSAILGLAALIISTVAIIVR
jgi:hypothetical protein